jgi:hypothetical protein
LGYFAYLKTEKKSYLYLCGFFLGGALLTKYVANIFYVFFFAIPFLDYVIRQEKYSALGVSGYLKKRLRDYAILVSVSLLTYFIFLPAAWVDPKEILKATLFSQAFEKIWPFFAGIVLLATADTYLLKSKLFSPVLEKLAKNRQKIIFWTIAIFAASAVFCAVNTYLGMKWYDFETILASPKSSYLKTGFLGMFFSGFYPAIFGISPLALFGIIFYFFKIFQVLKKEKEVSFDSAIFFYFLLLMILYYLASAASQVGATVRYQIVLYPVLFMFASMGFHAFSQIEILKKYSAKPIIILTAFVLSLWSLNSIRPFYFSYASALLPENYVLNLKDMGDGSYEAAQYLNKLPDSSLKGIWTDKKGVCQFFYGRCYIGAELKEKDLEKIDYFVVSSGRQSRTSSINKNRLITQETDLAIYPLYSSDDFDFKLEIGGRAGNFIKVFSSSKIKKKETETR